MAQPSFIPPLAALTTIFNPPCETSWLITTTKVPSQDPPFPSAGPITCDPPAWSANLDDLGFQYYSPAICPRGFAVGPKCQVKDARTAEGFPAIAQGETAVYCVPSGFTCTSDTTDFRGGVWGVAGNTNAPANRLLVTVAPAMQIRWKDADLAILQTHPLTPGLLLDNTDRQTSPGQEPTPPPAAALPTITLGSTQTGRTDSPSTIVLTPTADPESASPTQTQPLTQQPTSPGASPPQGTNVSSSSSSSSIIRQPPNTPSNSASPGSTDTALPGENSEAYAENKPAWDWKTGAIAMVLSALLVTLGVIAFFLVLLRRNKPNDPWSRFMRTTFGQWLHINWEILAASAVGIWIAARIASIKGSKAGIWIKDRWEAIIPRRRPVPQPKKMPPAKPDPDADPEFGGIPPTPTTLEQHHQQQQQNPIAELDAEQRLGSPGNPAELDAIPNRWSPLRWSRSSGSASSFGVVSKVKSWLMTTAQPSARWTRAAFTEKEKASAINNNINSNSSSGGGGMIRPISTKSSRAASMNSALEPVQWEAFAPTNSLKSPSAAHIRNNSRTLVDVLEASSKVASPKDHDVAAPVADKGKAKDTSLLGANLMREYEQGRMSKAEMLNRLSTGTFGAGRASSHGEPQPVDPVPSLPSRESGKGSSANDTVREQR